MRRNRWAITARIAKNQIPGWQSPLLRLVRGTQPRSGRIGARLC